MLSTIIFGILSMIMACVVVTAIVMLSKPRMEEKPNIFWDVVVLISGLMVSFIFLMGVVCIAFKLQGYYMQKEPTISVSKYEQIQEPVFRLVNP